MMNTIVNVSNPQAGNETCNCVDFPAAPSILSTPCGWWQFLLTGIGMNNFQWVSALRHLSAIPLLIPNTLAICTFLWVCKYAANTSGHKKQNQQQKKNCRQTYVTQTGISLIILSTLVLCMTELHQGCFRLHKKDLGRFWGSEAWPPLWTWKLCQIPKVYIMTQSSRLVTCKQHRSHGV